MTAAKIAADKMEAYGLNYVWRGINTNSPMFNGWPLKELYEEAVSKTPAPGELVSALSEMLSRHPQVRSPLTQGIIHGQTQIPAVTLSTPIERTYSLEEMLSMRMRWGGSHWGSGFHHVAVHRVQDTVHVWMISKDGQSLVLEDELGLYPSDALITKINMLVRE